MYVTVKDIETISKDRYVERRVSRTHTYPLKKKNTIQDQAWPPADVTSLISSILGLAPDPLLISTFKVYRPRILWDGVSLQFHHD